jgi:hypothetical protein
MQFMRDYFYAQGDGKGLPLEELQNYGYNDIMRLRIYYDWSTDDLMEVSPIRPCETWPLAPSEETFSSSSCDYGAHSRNV